MDTTARALAERLLDTLHLLNAADDQKLACDPGPYGHVRQALLATICTVPLWGPRQADEAITYAMADGCTLFDAMRAIQQGPIRAALPDLPGTPLITA